MKGPRALAVTSRLDLRRARPRHPHPAQGNAGPPQGSLTPSGGGRRMSSAWGRSIRPRAADPGRVPHARLPLRGTPRLRLGRAGGADRDYPRAARVRRPGLAHDLPVLRAVGHEPAAGAGEQLRQRAFQLRASRHVRRRRDARAEHWLLRNDREEDCPARLLIDFDHVIAREDKDMLEATDPNAVIDTRRSRLQTLC